MGAQSVGSIVLASVFGVVLAGVVGIVPAPSPAGAQSAASPPIKYYIENTWAQPPEQAPRPPEYVVPGPENDGTPVPPRKPWGHPDIEGIFMKRPRGVGLNSAFQTQPLPFTPEGLKAFNAVWDYVDPTSKCIFPGMPRLLFSSGNPVQVVQTPTNVVMLYEYMHNFRVIWLDGRPHPKNLLPSFNGHSVGRWEGDTLVVDTVGLRGGNIDDHANVVSDAVHLVERYRRASANQLAMEITIDDPKYYTKPWTASWLMPHAPPHWELGEYACTDFNYSMDSGSQQPGPLDGSLRDGGPIGRVPPAPR